MNKKVQTYLVNRPTISYHKFFTLHIAHNAKKELLWDGRGSKYLKIILVENISFLLFQMEMSSKSYDLSRQYWV